MKMNKKIVKDMRGSFSFRCFQDYIFPVILADCHMAFSRSRASLIFPQFTWEKEKKFFLAMKCERK
jgi:hypothetical protein